jgi:uncharacterized protein (DUF2236 family)
LPQPIRAIYGLEWGNWRQRAFDLSTWSIRTVMPLLPMHFRELAITRYLMEKGESRWSLTTEEKSV